MNEIICPHCGKAFKVDEAGYADILKQVRDHDFEKQLQTLSDLEIVGEVRGSHYMLAIEYVADKKLKTPFADEIAIGKRVYYHCKQRGLILRPIGPLNVLSPPLTYDQAAIDQTVAIIKESILATQDDLVKENQLLF